MKLLISPKDVGEAREAINGGADIIDVKNPKEGSLGANFPWIIKEIEGITPKDREISAAIGDFPNIPGTASLAALGAAISGADYVKVGLYGLSSKEDAILLASSVVKSVKDYDKGIKVVVAGYADFYRINSINPMIIPEIGKKSGADIIMLDTAIKDGKKLFDHIPMDKLIDFVKDSHNYGISVALGGSLSGSDIEPLYQIGVDIIGIRGAACDGNDRLNGRIKAEMVRKLKERIPLSIKINKESPSKR